MFAGAQTRMNPTPAPTTTIMNDIGEPLPFPAPNLVRGQMRRLFVSVSADRDPIEKIVLHTETNHFYEVGRLLKEAIYGQVNHGYLLEVNTIANVLCRSESCPQVAIKIYNQARLRAMHGRTQENPLAEMSMMQIIGDHPHVMTPIECAQDSERIYMIMSFCDSGELYDLVEENGHLPESLARSYFKQIICGLCHLQSLGIAHRDMSLENIMVGGNGTICKIIDFGMSLRIPRNPMTGQLMRIHNNAVCGKKNYFSPEMIQSSMTPHQAFNPCISDIWAVGVMLFIMLTGCPPVEVATMIDRRFQMIAEDRLGDMIRQWGIVDLSPEAIDLVQRILRPNPHDRLTLIRIQNLPWKLAG